MTIFVHHELSVPSYAMKVWTMPSTHANSRRAEYDVRRLYVWRSRHQL